MGKVPAGWRAVADRVWFRRYGFGDENVGLIGSGAGLVIVDTRATEVDADRLVADVRELSDEPIVGVVNTHGHWDHAFGNARFAGIPIWGQRRCPAFMAATAEQMRGRLLSTEPFSQQADALRAVRITPPTHLVDEEQVLDVGGREVRLLHFGRGHTDCDLIVQVPDSGVLFVGDLVKQNGPPGYRDGFPISWPVTMLRLLELARGPVVPGHGDLTSRSFVAEFTDRLAVVADLAVAVNAGQLDQEEASARAPIHPRAFTQALNRIEADRVSDVDATTDHDAAPRL
jgi:glyoxylase-like metal-dependent hydrolase (beta-lactamase superfamily II)